MAPLLNTKITNIELMKEIDKLVISNNENDDSDSTHSEYNQYLPCSVTDSTVSVPYPMY